MANGQVNIKWTSEHQQLLDAYRQLQRSNDKLQQQMAALQNKSAQAFDASKLLKYAASVISISTAWALATRGLTMYMEAQRKLRQESSDKTVAFDEEFRKFRVVSGMTDNARAAKAQNVAYDVAERYSTDPGKVAEAAKELSSAGFSDQEIIEGGVLDSFIKAMRAGGMSGQEFNPSEAVEAITAIMNANNLPKTAESMDRINEAIVNLGETKIRVSELKDLAAEASTLAGAHITPEEQLATFAALRETFAAPEAATLYRNVVGRLQTAAGSPAKVKALSMLGIKPEEVDFVGETQEEVLARLQQGVESVSEETANVALSKLFEERGVAGARYLLDNQDKIKENEAMIEQDRFGTALNIATQGPSHERRAAEIADERAVMATYTPGDSAAQARANTMALQQGGPLVRGVVSSDVPVVGGTPVDLLQNMGLPPQIAVPAAVTGVDSALQTGQEMAMGSVPGGQTMMMMMQAAQSMQQAADAQNEAADKQMKAADAARQQQQQPAAGPQRVAPPRLPVARLSN